MARTHIVQPAAVRVAGQFRVGDSSWRAGTIDVNWLIFLPRILCCVYCTVLSEVAEDK